MANAPEPGNQRPRPQLPERFKIVTGGPGPQHVVRDPAGAKVSRIGRTPLNAESSEIIEKLATEQFDGIHLCGIVWFADEKAQEIAGYLDEPHATGITAIKRDVPGGPLVVNLSRIWKKHPDLRPSSVKWCSFSLKPEGYFVIHLGMTIDRNKVTRQQKKSQPQKEAPAAPPEGQEPA